ncbi:MAG: ATP-binding protein [Dysgonamonadaceae bacterium]|jgi:hypothetical protein|nr:ATP-binding protein [Dysgonamonadaceae bacterium]
MKNLPIGTQSFEILRTTNCVYVDKTEIIYRLITTGRVYFLSRPRRFGKSLLISTMEAIFKGKKELFEGLYIYDRWDWSLQYPVIRIDWSNIKHATPEEMERSMLLFLKRHAALYQITLVSEYASDCFAELIELLHLKTGQQVVVLIDEYDVPILDAIGATPELMKKTREWIHDFYRILKAGDEHLRFIFLTGVSKFSGLSVFSALNNINDISMDSQYASVCGYTQPELESYFADYIDITAENMEITRETLLKNIRCLYNGYTWDGKTPVYNPFSTLLFFYKKEFAGYWFRTGTPTFLINILRQRNQLNVVLEEFTVDASVFDSFDPESIAAEPLLFQTGYLTVKRKELVDEGRPQYTLALPNREVRESLLKHLLNVYTEYPVAQTDSLKSDMQRHICECDGDGLANDLRRMLACVPYNLQVAGEAYYHSIFLIWMKLLGFDIQGELMTNTGRIDAVWRQNDLTVVAELKFHRSKSAKSLLKDALAQIREKRYYERFADRKVLLLGVAFTGKDVACRMETI